MTLASATTAIFTTLSASWATATPIAYPNHPFVPPQRGYWIRPVIKVVTTNVAELGDVDSGAVGLRDGLLMVSLFCPQGDGTKTLNLLADRLERIFRRADVDNVWFDEPSSNPVGEDGNGYYHIMMTCDFHTWVGE